MFKNQCPLATLSISLETKKRRIYEILKSKKNLSVLKRGCCGEDGKSYDVNSSKRVVKLSAKSE
jgi:hypothetical protein